jgi:hypothetical protein
MSIPTRQTTKALAEAEKQANEDTTGSDVPPEVPSINPVAESINTDTDINVPPLIRNDLQFHELFDKLLNTVETLADNIQTLTNTNSVLPDNVKEKEAEAVPVIVTEAIPAGIINGRHTSGIRSLYSKFTPAKITPKYAEISLAQLESWMDINNITEDHERFLLLKMNIEPETYRAVATALATPHPGREYENLKMAILKAFTISEAKQIQSLLSGLQLGDRRPTQLLSEMCNLYKGPKDKIFEELFLSRLPATVRGILVSMKNKDDSQKNIETIAQWADAIMEQTGGPPSVSTIALPPDASALQNTLNMMNDNICAIHRSTETSRFRPPFRKRSFKQIDDDSKSERENHEQFVCYFHRKFGNNKHENKKCSRDCKLNKAWQEARSKLQKN